MVENETLALRIRMARIESKQSQASVAKAIGISRTAFVQIEACNRDVSALELMRIANVFGKDVQWFLPDRTNSVPVAGYSIKYPVEIMASAPWNVLDYTGTRIARCGYDDDDLSGEVFAMKICGALNLIKP